MGLFSCSVPLWLPLKPGTAVDTDTVDTAVDMEVMVDTVLDTAMVDTVARDPLTLKPMPGMAVDTVMVDTVDTDMVDTEDTDMVDTVAREKPKLKLKPGTVTLDTDTVPDTELELMDTVPDTVPDTDSATAMVDTVERDPLMPGTDAVMVVMVDTPVDTDTDVDTDTKHLSSQLTKETILYKIMPL